MKEIIPVFTLKTAPTFEPVTLELAKEQLRISSEDQDRVLEAYLKAARQWVETYTGRALATQTWQMSLDHIPTQLPLSMAAPLQSVTFLKYYDENNAQQTWSSSNYITSAFHEPAVLEVLTTVSRPSIYQRSDAVQVEYVCGYASGACPDGLALAVMALAGHFYENREAGIALVGPMLEAMQAQCQPYCVKWRETQCR